MYRVVLTSMVGLMLSFGGGASALTFKSDGTVVQSDGTVVQGHGSSLSKPNSNKLIRLKELASSALPLCPLQLEANNWNNCFGETISPGGDRYVGEFKSGEFHGQGTLEYFNGNKFVGHWREGSAQGQGTITYASGGQYSGDWQDSEMHGWGTERWPNGDKYVGEYSDGKFNGRGIYTFGNGNKYVGEYKNNKRHGLGKFSFAQGHQPMEGIWDNDKFLRSKKLDSTYTEDAIDRSKLVTGSQTEQSQKKVLGSAAQALSDELIAQQERTKQLELEIALLKAQQKQQQPLSSDNQAPSITIVSALSNGPQGKVRGKVTDNNGVAELRIDGQPLAFDASGGFTAKTYVPEGGISVTLEAFDLSGLSTSMSVRLDRAAADAEPSIAFDKLNPLRREASKNPHALALIIGVDSYAKTQARAIYADSDARVFQDYATQKIGIPAERIRTLINETADEAGLLLSVQDWLSRAVKQEQSDVYIFFAGHGLASDDGKKMYLLPYDGSPRLLSRTALLRDELFSDIAQANPRSVTVFLDTCYSGTTRGPDMLIASRPIAIRAKESAVPEGFTVMTAAAGDQTAKPLEEAKHGMFSYFLMKGMEGDADTNQDNQITAGELQEYVYQNVVQQSSGSQTPELQGDADRVLVRFQ